MKPSMPPPGRATRALLFLFVLLVATPATALPPTQAVNDEQDDARIFLTLLDQVITDDARSYCELRILVTGERKEFRNGDQVFLWVKEDDLAGDDDLWVHDFAVSADEVRAQRVDRTFDCSAAFGDDVGDRLEIYADSRVEKDACGLGCRYDRPETRNLVLQTIEDDAAEQDDARNASRPIPLGRTSGRIARDQDWLGVAMPDPGRITLTAHHRAGVGRVDTVLFDADGGQIAVGADADAATEVRTDALPAGDYFVRVSPRNGNDYNFYDAELRVVTANCQPGLTENDPCGRCGQRERACQPDGNWGEWGACGNEGPCQPGATEQDDCAGVQVRERTCTAECQWGPYGECSGGDCDEAEDRECYTGPEGTNGVGACRGGEQMCVAGAWGDCQGEVVPTDEVCGDDVDDDCDGDLEDADACGAGRPVGSPCEADDDCAGELICLTMPDHPQFLGGYCGRVDCDGDAACTAEGVCGDAVGGTFCLKICDDAEDCRAGYACGDVGADDAACIPRCVRDAECTNPDFPVCDPDSGLCIEAVEPPACQPDNYEPNASPNEADVLAPGTYQNLTLCPGDDDFFAIELCDSGTLTVNVRFSHADGDIEASLVGRNGNELARSTSSTDDEELVYTADVGGTVYARIYTFAETGPRYSLEIAVEDCGVEPPPVDAAPPPPPRDAGGDPPPPPPPPRQDASPPNPPPMGNDAGVDPGGGDGGAGDLTASADEGCSCDLSGRAPAFPALLLLALAAGLIRRRRA